MFGINELDCRIELQTDKKHCIYSVSDSILKVKQHMEIDTSKITFTVDSTNHASCDGEVWERFHDRS